MKKIAFLIFLPLLLFRSFEAKASSSIGLRLTGEGSFIYTDYKPLAIAEQIGIPFHWKFGLVPHAGHSQSQMAATVVDILFGKQEE